jgi:hypothetical protein
MTFFTPGMNAFWLLELSCKAAATMLLVNNVCFTSLHKTLR